MDKTSEKTNRRVALIVISVMMVLALIAVTLPQRQANAEVLAVTCSTYHSVVSGETLSSIALKYNVTVQELATANDLTEPYQIYVGQRLCIPGSTVVATPGATGTATKGPTFTIKETKDPFTYEIATVGYPVKTPFYIRITRSDNNPPITTKLGTMKTNKSGVAKRNVRLPRQYRDAPVLTICLKNALTDGVQCKSFVPQS
jgi:LysM repeat protein